MSNDPHQIIQQISTQWKEIMSEFPNRGRGEVLASFGRVLQSEEEPDTLIISIQQGWFRAFTSDKTIIQSISDLITAKYGFCPQIRIVSSQNDFCPRVNNDSVPYGRNSYKFINYGTMYFNDGILRSVIGFDMIRFLPLTKRPLSDDIYFAGQFAFDEEKTVQNFPQALLEETIREGIIRNKFFVLFDKRGDYLYSSADNINEKNKNCIFEPEYVKHVQWRTVPLFFLCNEFVADTTSVLSAKRDGYIGKSNFDFSAYDPYSVEDVSFHSDGTYEIEGEKSCNERGYYIRRGNIVLSILRTQCPGKLIDRVKPYVIIEGKVYSNVFCREDTWRDRIQELMEEYHSFFDNKAKEDSFTSSGDPVEKLIQKVTLENNSTLSSKDGIDNDNMVKKENIHIKKRIIADSGMKTSLNELDDLIGLDVLKNDVRELVNLVKLQQIRKKRGLKSIPVSLHLVFTGNPGTGKTTVARILAKIYKEIGVLSEGQLIEVDRSNLVAGYVGQTAIKTQEKINESIGGILFIDEAYTLAKDRDDYGQEAIDTILKAMEDHRDDFVVIVAGYPELMSRFINSNPGLKSRFNKFIFFPDYEVNELEEIFYLMCNKYDYHIEENAKAEVRSRLESICATKDENFANARDVRNYFEKIVANQATRVMNIANVNDSDIMTIKTEDVVGEEFDSILSDEKNVTRSFGQSREKNDSTNNNPSNTAFQTEKTHSREEALYWARKSYEVYKDGEEYEKKLLDKWGEETYKKNKHD